MTVLDCSLLWQETLFRERLIPQMYEAALLGLLLIVLPMFMVLLQGNPIEHDLFQNVCVCVCVRERELDRLS